MEFARASQGASVPMLGPTLASLRLSRCLSRERLGAAAGISARTIYSIEVGAVDPLPATLRALAAALGCDDSTLTDEDKRLAGQPGAVTPTAVQGRDETA